MSYSWIKLYHEILHDPKMGMLTEHLWNLAIKCFLLAGEQCSGGLLPPINEMAWTLRAAPDDIERGLVELSKVNITELTEEGWKVVNFEKRQSAMTDAERKAMSRLTRKRVTVRDNAVTENVREEEEEEEEDSEEEKEEEGEEEANAKPSAQSAPPPETTASGKTSTAKPAKPAATNTRIADLPEAARLFLEKGGKLPAGKLADGTRKADKAITFITEKVRTDAASLGLWGQVVEAYCAMWSPRSYTIMVNDYFLRGRIPGQSSGSGSGAPPRQKTAHDLVMEKMRELESQNGN